MCCSSSTPTPFLPSRYAALADYADEILVSKQVLRSKDKQVQRLAMELNQEREQFRFQLRTTEQTFTVNEGKIRAEYVLRVMVVPLRGWGVAVPASIAIAATGNCGCCFAHLMNG